MSLDMTKSIEPRSDQVNADDLIGGPITYTIREVIDGKAESPFDFLLVETDRAYRPSKTMRRVIVNAWGADAKVYAGRRLTLYREPSIMFGGQKVGGIRISHMSDISGSVEVMAQTTRGKREKFVVKPLAAGPKIASNAPGSPEPDEPNRDTGAPVAEGEPAFGANLEPTMEGGAASTRGASESEAPAPQESLRAAINRQVREIQGDGGGAHLQTWCASQGVAQTSGAIADRFGEAARDMRSLMAQEVES